MRAWTCIRRRPNKGPTELAPARVFGLFTLFFLSFFLFALSAIPPCTCHHAASYSGQPLLPFIVSFTTFPVGKFPIIFSVAGRICRLVLTLVIHIQMYMDIMPEVIAIYSRHCSIRRV